MKKTRYQYKNLTIKKINKLVPIIVTSEYMHDDAVTHNTHQMDKMLFIPYRTRTPYLCLMLKKDITASYYLIFNLTVDTNFESTVVLNLNNIFHNGSLLHHALVIHSNNSFSGYACVSVIGIFLIVLQILPLKRDHFKIGFTVPYLSHEKNV